MTFPEAKEKNTGRIMWKEARTIGSLSGQSCRWETALNAEASLPLPLWLAVLPTLTVLQDTFYTSTFRKGQIWSCFIPTWRKCWVVFCCCLQVVDYVSLSAARYTPVHCSQKAIHSLSCTISRPGIPFPQLPSHISNKSKCLSVFQTYVANHACNACFVSLSLLPLPRSPSPTLSQSPSFSPVLPFFLFCSH